MSKCLQGTSFIRLKKWKCLSSKGQGWCPKTSFPIQEWRRSLRNMHTYIYLYLCLCTHIIIHKGGKRDEQVVYRSSRRRSTGRPKKPKWARSSPREVDTFTWFLLFLLKSTTEKRIGGAITTHPAMGQIVIGRMANAGRITSWIWKQFTQLHLCARSSTFMVVVLVKSMVVDHHLPYLNCFHFRAAWSWVYTWCNII